MREAQGEADVLRRPLTVAQELGVVLRLRAAVPLPQDEPLLEGLREGEMVAEEESAVLGERGLDVEGAGDRDAEGVILIEPEAVPETSVVNDVEPQSEEEEVAEEEMLPLVH